MEMFHILPTAEHGKITKAKNFASNKHKFRQT